MRTGFVNVNKPSGVSSGYAVNRIKKLAGLSCGHMGTLDPLASGVLPVALGNAARLFDYMLEKRKRYVAVFRFGVMSDTLDSTGQLDFSNPFVPSEGADVCAPAAFDGKAEAVIAHPFQKFDVINMHLFRGEHELLARARQLVAAHAVHALRAVTGRYLHDFSDLGMDCLF